MGDKKDNCVATGLTLGRSTSFITAVMCEMLRAYTVRSIEPAVYVFNRNKWMHIACLFSFTMTVLLTIIPGVKQIFYLDTPDWFYYFIAFIFAFGCATNDELFKYLYRRTLRHESTVTSDAGMRLPQSSAWRQLWRCCTKSRTVQISTVSI